MTPALQTLAPDAGLARSFAVVAPDGRGIALWKVLVDVGLAEVGDYPLAYVGAYDVRRRSALERGAGEAVERFALAQAAEPEVWAAPDAFRGGDHAAAVWPRWLGDDAFLTTPRGWYRGKRLADGQPVLVPAAAVDDHGGERRKPATNRDFDPSPSGAAAGLSAEAAVQAALLEVVERDAVLCAWATGVGASRLDVGSDPGCADDDRDPGVSRLLAEAARVGLRPIFCELPTAVLGVHVRCCAVIDRDADGVLVGFGSKAAVSPAAATRGALQEALQIHELLTNLRARHARPSPFEAAVPDPALVADDVARAWWWTTESAAASMESWIGSWAEPAAGSASAPAPGLDDVVASITRDGGDPILADLGHRLPRAVRDLGWHVVKVLCPGYQQLRLDETVTETWNRTRLAAWSTRHGGPAGEPSSKPHPLI